MAEELLDKIPAEMCWAITAKIIEALFVMRGEKIIAPILGKGEGIISPIWGAEKWQEIHFKIWGDGGVQMMPMCKEMFNIPVEDAIGAAKLGIVCAILVAGPEMKSEIEATRERAIVRYTKCAWWETYIEFEIDPEVMSCIPACSAWIREGLKAVNPKITHKLIKSMGIGDPYCEEIIEFKENNP